MTARSRWDCFSHHSAIEETEKRSLGGNIVESGRSCTRLKPFADQGARIAGKCGHDGGLPRAGLSQEPNHRCGSLCAFAGAVSLSHRWLAIGKPNNSKRVQERHAFHSLRSKNIVGPYQHS
jgi:hypothetical protein